MIFFKHHFRRDSNLINARVFFFCGCLLDFLNPSLCLSVKMNSVKSEWDPMKYGKEQLKVSSATAEREVGDGMEWVGSHSTSPAIVRF